MKTNILKKWWFWVIVVVIIAAIGGGLGTTENNIGSDGKPLNDSKTETKEIFIKTLENTVWEPDFVKYPNHYHADNPILTLTHISNDGTVLTFEDEKGISHKARICAGWNHPGEYDPNIFEEGLYIQYLFDDPEFYYGITVHGCTPKSDFDEPTLFFSVTEGGWYEVIYTIKD